MDQTTLELIIGDLKQFIGTTVLQATSGIETRLNGIDLRLDGMDQRFDGLERKMEQRFDDLELKLDTIADAHAEDIANHEQRLTRLESKTA